MAGNKKCNSEAEKIPASGENKKWGVLEWVTAGSVLTTRFLFYIFVNMPQIATDSESYLTLTWDKFLRGERMPLYPMIIQINRLLFRDGYLMGVVGCQITVSLLSVLYLYRAIRLATGNRGIACIMAFFYGGNPWIMYFDVEILSESFAISISVFLLYHTVCYIRSHLFQSGLAMVICILLAVFEKAALVVYVPAFLFFLAIQFFCLRDMRKIVLKLSLALLGIDLLLLLYAGQVWRNAGTFSVDKRGPKHMLAACLETGLYKNYPDRSLVAEIENIWMKKNKALNWQTTLGPIMNLFGDDLKEYNRGVSEFNDYCIRSDFGVYLNYLCQRFNEVMIQDYIINQLNLDNNSLIFCRIYQTLLIVFMPMKIGNVYLIGWASLLLMIVKWRRKKECPWYYLGTAGMISVIIVSVVVGTYSEFPRCTSYVLPFAFFGLALLLNDLIVWLGNYRD